VTATDLYGFAASATVTLDVDKNNDGDFLDAGEAGYQTGTLVNGSALFTLAPALAVGTVKVRARVSDLAGNEGTSATSTLQVQSSGSAWTLTDLTPQVDVNSGDPTFQRGDLTVSQVLDLNQSPGTALANGDGALAYNSERVGVKPIIQAEVQSDNSVALPATISAQLTFNGVAQASQNFNTTGLSPGDLIVVAQQVSSTQATGGYPYTLTVTMNYATPIVRSVTGEAFVAAEDSSPFGAGWTLAPVDRLTSVAATQTFAAGMLREYGAGGLGFYADNGAGGYASPAGDPGTLTKATGGGLTTYTYYLPDGRTWTFNNSGQEVTYQGADGLEATSFSYASTKLSGIQTPDGALTTVTYSGGQATLETGSRTVTLTLNANGDLTTAANPDGGLHTLAYSGTSHLLTQDNLGVLQTTYAYSSGAESSYTPGDGGHFSVSPAVLSGLSSLAAAPLYATVTDPLGRVTRKQLDTSGRPTQEIAPDGGVTQWTRDGNGWVTKEVDPLLRTTTYLLDTTGAATMVYLPDGNTRKYQYQSAYTPGGSTVHHALTQYTDERGAITTSTYDNQGHKLTDKDALGDVTSYGYITSGADNGLLQTVTDPLGRVTTTVYDSSRRYQQTIDPAGNIASVTYDSNGNEATAVDPLGHTTTMVNDALGRVLQLTDAVGNLTSYAYDYSGLETTARDPLGHVTSMVYNSRGLLTKEVDAVGTAVQRTLLDTYDADGELASSRDGDGFWSTFGYNPDGEETGATDPLGEKSQTYYDYDGEVLLSIDPVGNETFSTYNSRGWLSTATDALNEVTTTAYDAAGDVTQVTDPLGNSVTYAYDLLGRKTFETDGAGSSVPSTTSTVYDAVGNVIKQYDALGHYTQTDYDSLNRATTVTLAKGTSAEAVLTYAYDKAGNQTSATDARGIRTDTTFDSDNRPTVVKEDAGGASPHTTTTVYDGAGNATSVADALGHTASMVYDALNRQVSLTEAAGTALADTTTTVYDGDDAAADSVDPLGLGTQEARDAAGRVVASIDPLGLISRTVYDADGNPVASIDPRGNRTTSVFDALNRVVQAADALNEVTSTVFDAAGNTQATVDALGHRTTMTYDAQNRETSVKDALGHVTSTVYDAAGNVVQTVGAAGNTTSMTYDAQNRRLTVQDPGGGIATTVYDNAGNVVNSIDPLGNKTTYTYDDFGRQTQVTDPRGGVTTTIYDNLGNQTGLIDPVGNRTTFVYDSLNRKTTETDPLNHSLTYAYDLDGRLTSQTDRLGRRIDHTYDQDGRETTTVWRDAGGTAVNTLVYSFDNDGNMLTAGDSHGTYTMAYDAQSQMTSVQGLFGTSLTFSYDSAGNRTVVQDSFGGTTTSVYDAANRLTTRKFTDGTTPLRFDLAYTSRDQVLSLTRYSDLNGTVTVGYSTYTYDAAGRTQNIQHRNSGGTTFENYTYTYDLASRVTSEQLNGSTTSYQYDKTNQLTSDGVHSYAYDANGNRNSAGYTTGPANQMTNDGTYTYTYDNEGNQTKKSKGSSAETWTYTYDTRNQLVGITERSTDGGGTLLFVGTYAYDVFGNRIETDEWTSGTGTVTTKTAYDDQGSAWADLTSGNALQTRYLSRPGSVAPVARIASGAAAWLLEDRLGSVRNVVDASGTLISTVVYDGFGNITSETSAANTGKDGFTGLPQNRTTLFVQAKARPVQTPTGTFPVEDLIRWTSGETNLHRLDRNNPTDVTDPSGLEGEGWWVFKFLEDTWLYSYTQQVYWDSYRRSLNAIMSNGAPFEAADAAARRIAWGNAYGQRAAAPPQEWHDRVLGRFALDPRVGTIETMSGSKTVFEAADQVNRLITEKFPVHMLVFGATLAITVTEGKAFDLFLRATFKGGSITYRFIKGKLRKFVGKEAKEVTKREAKALYSQFKAAEKAAPKAEVMPGAGARSRPSFKKRKAGLTGKEAATDVPDWISRLKDNRPYVDETGIDFATRMLNTKYGAGNWTRKGQQGREFSQLKKYGDRAFENP
jgi:YD repeat-containing protein